MPITAGMKSLQLPNGSFTGAIDGVENDMRFVYCACCICHILDNWSGINIELMVDFILNSIVSIQWNYNIISSFQYNFGVIN